MKKYEKVAQLLRRRIENDDYNDKAIPGARRLAKETGVSYLTALKALQHLVDSNLAVRNDYGRLEPCPQELTGEAPVLKVAYLTSARAEYYYVWENAVQSAAVKLNCSFKMITYTHADDPVISDVIAGSYDVVFLAHTLREGGSTRELVKRYPDKVVTMFVDMTADGVRCFDGPSPRDTEKLVEYLYGLGHRDYACFMVCPQTQSTQEKMGQWDAAVRVRGCVNHEYRQVLNPFEYSLVPSYELATKLLTGKKFTHTAVFVPSLEIGIGFIRAMHDLGLKTGESISVCSFGQPEKARMHIPSITIIDRPDPLPQAEAILQQSLLKNTDSLMFRPEKGELIIGESTGKAPTIKIR